MSDRGGMDIVIKATDQASAVIKKIADEEARLGKVAEASGKQAAAGLKQIDAAAKQNARSFDDVVKGAASLGQAVGLAVGVLGRFGQASVNEANSVRSLGLAYGDSARDVILFSEAIQDTTNFSNDAARQAALLGSTLTREYGLSSDQAEQLVQRSADLAQVYGFDLPNAMNRSASAVRGEAEAAESMGVAMADSVLQAKAAELGIDNWTTSATEAEKAGVRFDEFMRQTAFVDGSAALAADTTAGKVAHLKNELQDAATSFGGFLGPVGQATSELSTYGFALAGAATGVQVLRQAQGALNLAMVGGPAGLAAGALLAAGSIYFLSQRGEEWKTVAGEAAEGTANLTDQFLALGDAGLSVLTSSQIAGQFQDYNAIVADATDALADFNEQQELMSKGDQAALDVAVARIQEYGVELGNTAEIQGQLASQLSRLDEALTAVWELPPGVQEVAVANATALFDAYEDGRLTFEQLLDALEASPAHYTEYVANQKAAADATTATTLTVEEQTKALIEHAGTISDVNEIYGTLQQAGVKQATQTSRQVQLWLDEQAAATGATTAFQRLGDHALSAGDKVHTLTAELDAQRETFLGLAPAVIAANAALDAERVAVVGLITDLGQMPTLLDVIGGVAEDGTVVWRGYWGEMQTAISVARGLRDSMEALDVGISVVINGTERLGSQLGTLDDWATALIDVEGEQGRINELLSRGVIEQDEANEAYAAAERIIRANAAAQDDLSSIQVQQADYLADLTEEQVRYIDTLEKMPEAQQRIALGFLDQTEAAKLNGAIMLAATASQNGYTEAASATILTLAEQDSVFRDMGLSVGLLRYEIDETGKKQLVVNFDGAESLQGTIDDLVESIDLLTDALLGLPPGTTIRLHVEGAQEIWDAKQALTELYALANQRIAPADFSRFATPDSLPLSTLSTPPGGTPSGPHSAAGTRTVDAPPPPPPFTDPNRPGFVPPAGTPTAPPPFHVTLDTAGALASLGELFDAVAASEPIITVDAETAPAVLSVTELVATADASTGTVQIDGDNARALGAVDDAVATADSASGTVSIGGDPSPFYGTVNSLDGRIVGTAYMQIVGLPGSGLTGIERMLGGVIPGAANGRIVEMAEAGGEWVGTPGGGGFLAAQHGLYGVPAGSMVHTAPATRAMGLDRGGGITVNLTIAGNVYGIDDLAGHVGEQIALALERVAPDYYGSQGWHG